MSEKKFSDYNFGFENLEEFSSAVKKYVDRERLAQETDLSWLDMLGESQKQAALQVLEKSRKSFANLEQAVEDMPGLYHFVRGIYDELLELEKDPNLNKLEPEFLDEAIAKKFLNRSEQIKPISQLIEHGLVPNSWGYKFIQAWASVRFFEE